jgi:hypothetical protein
LRDKKVIALINQKLPFPVLQNRNIQKECHSDSKAKCHYDNNPKCHCDSKPKCHCEERQRRSNLYNLKSYMKNGGEIASLSLAMTGKVKARNDRKNQNVGEKRMIISEI